MHIEVDQFSLLTSANLTNLQWPLLDDQALEMDVQVRYSFYYVNPESFIKFEAFWIFCQKTSGIHAISQNGRVIHPILVRLAAWKYEAALVQWGWIRSQDLSWRFFSHHQKMHIFWKCLPTVITTVHLSAPARRGAHPARQILLLTGSLQSVVALAVSRIVHALARGCWWAFLKQWLAAFN